ncbi:Ig-like domain repeat protein [Methanobrevibacter sp.]|uniref:Ig-like domain repeat protein n=1 Tax=Methanobrevibacter sp. TaxID=66852 RepID=UPI00388D66F4
MKKYYKRTLILLLVLAAVIMSTGFVSASENITGDVVDESSFQELIGENLAESVDSDDSKIITQIDIKNTNSYYKENVNVEVKLKDSNGTPLANKNVDVYFNGKVENKTTDGSGKLILSYNALKPSNYKLNVKFAGDENFTSSDANFNVKVNKVPLAVKMSNFKTYYKSGSFFTAKVYNKITKNPVSGIKVQFKVYSLKTKKYSYYYATTNSKGVATLKKNLKVGTYKISAQIKDSKNKKYISYKPSKTKATMKVKSSPGEDCCSFFLQVSATESVAGFRRDNTAMTTITIKEDKLGGIPVVKHVNAGGFVHLIVFANGWIVGNGGLDSLDFINSMQKLAVDMVKSNKIKKSSLQKIYRYKHSINFGHFSIKAPDGRYAVVWKNKIITGKLKPGEFSCSPNFKEYYRHSTYKKYSTNPAKAAIKVGATDHYGVNRRQVVALHWKATTDKNFKTTSSIKAYAANDNGRFVGVSSGRLVDNVKFKNKFFSAHKLPKVPNKKYLGVHKFGNIDKLVKIPTKISAPKVTNDFNQTKYFKVTIKNKNTNKVVKGLKIKIKITSVNGTKTYSVKTDKKGVAKINTKNFLIGSYKVVLAPATNKYLISGKSGINIV